MNTKVLFLGVVVAAFSFSAMAAAAPFSARAQSNFPPASHSAVTTPGVTITYVAASTSLLSPRAQANQSHVIKGVVNEINPALTCQKTMSGSPKTVAECSAHTTMPGCMTLVAAK